MKNALTIDEKLQSRKLPAQSRSRKTVERILGAARRLLQEQGGITPAHITTNHIAREAGVSVGSLYQYFPNKEAIFFGLYREMLEQVSAVIKRFKTEECLALPRAAFFARLNQALKNAEAEANVVINMHQAMKMYPTLAAADRRHAESLAQELAGFMRRFGSPWPLEKLRRLALFVYYINYGSWDYRAHAGPPPREVLSWELGAYNFMLGQCFDPPPGDQ